MLAFHRHAPLDHPRCACRGIAQQLGRARRPLKDGYTALMLDGVVLARKTGAGTLKRPVLVALGRRPDGKNEIIDPLFADWIVRRFPI